MKKIAIILTLFSLSLSLSTCRKITYEEGDKLPRKKFLETINGVWKIEHGYISIDANTYTEDSVSFWNTRFGGNATLTIDYYNKMTLNWGSHEAISTFSNQKDEAGYSFFITYYYLTDEFSRDTSFKIFTQKLPFAYDINILKLDNKNLVISKGYGNHGNRLELTKK